MRRLGRGLSCMSGSEVPGLPLAGDAHRGWLTAGRLSLLLPDRVPRRAGVPTLLLLSLTMIGGGCGAAESSNRGAGRGTDESSLTHIGGLPASERALDQNGFEPIRLSDCAAFPPEGIEAWSSGQPGVFTTTGQPRGYLYTTQRYGDFTLDLEYRFERPESVREEGELSGRNTGFLVYVPAEHRVWPRSPEVQGRHDEMAGIKSNAPDLRVDVIEDNEPMRQLARRPVGEWNRITIVSRGGALQTFLNGVKIAESLPCELRQGHIGFQSEGHAVHFRNVRLRPE